MTEKKRFDVLVVGGGPAGLMAAAAALQKGARVALIEKGSRCGKKLLMTGNGRCNLTQDLADAATLSRAYKNGRFLISAFSSFGPAEIREFLREKGVETKVEENGRVFPASDRSEDVLRAFYDYLRAGGVSFFEQEEVKDVIASGRRITGIVTEKRKMAAINYVIATGGKSYPHTGSSGDGFFWAKRLGHAIVNPGPALSPIKTAASWASISRGISLRGASLAVLQKGRKLAKEKGDLMLAHFGLSGPLALNISGVVRQGLEKEEVLLVIDSFPDLSLEQLDALLARSFALNPARLAVSALGDISTPKFSKLIFSLAGLEAERKAISVSRKERREIARLFKHLEAPAAGVFGFEKAMVTDGGIAVGEVDSTSMRSRKIDNLFFAGEILDVHGPTGGYNLQLCWSSGFVAGSSAAMV